MIYYKICRKKDGVLKTLFHGLNGSKVINRGEWLQAEIKPVYDGSPKTSTEYISGWHVIKGYQNAQDYMGRFKDKSELVIVECKVKNIWKKEHSNSEVYLAEYMKVI